MQQGAVNAADGIAHCRDCRHFAVSWRPNAPYLCRFFGFVSQALPVHVVRDADGRECRGYLAKTKQG